MIRVRRAKTDADFEAWARVKRAVEPNESAWTPEQFRRRARPKQLALVAELGGAVVGCGYCHRSDLEGLASLKPRVLPEARRRGVGTALLRGLASHAETLGVGEAIAFADGKDAGSLAFAARFGFVEVDRQVEQVLTLGAEPEPPPLPPGVEAVTVAERPELLGEAYGLACEGYADMATKRPVTILLEDWLADEATLPAGSFLALADGEIVGYSGLVRHDNQGVAEDGLTVVGRDWRGRGLATALKRRKLAWAAAEGFREVVTWTQTGNEPMRAVNERLGYAYRDVTVNMTAPLPLELP